MRIQDQDVTFVVQGPVIPFETAAACRSIRQHFPDSKIVLSTWDGHPVGDIEARHLADVVIQMADVAPGFMNVNRQLLGTAAGLQLARTEYAVKVRSDGVFSHAGLLDAYAGTDDRGDRLRLFKGRVVVPSFTCYDPSNRAPSPLYHRCFQFTDWAAFGLTEDVRLLFSARPQALPDSRKSPEQYIWLSAIQTKYPEVDVRSMLDRNPRLVEETEVFAANNLIVLDALSQFGLKVAKYAHLVQSEPQWLTHEKWSEYYFKWASQAVLTPTTS